VLILGFDLGSTHTKVAFTEAEEISNGNKKPSLRSSTNHERITVLADFPGHLTDDCSETPTTLIYNSEGQLIHWGHHASRYLDSDEVQYKYVVQHWKLGLHDSSDPAAKRLQLDLQAAANRIWHGTKHAKTFAQDFARVFSRYLFKDDNSNLLGDLGGTLERFKYIDIALAVPPGWPRHEHRILRQMIALGMSETPALRFFTVSETECGLRAWLERDGMMDRVSVLNSLFFLFFLLTYIR
jgi:hypothetical protein